MTAKQSNPKKSDEIDYTEISEAEVQSVWPDLCMADRYNIAYEKVLQELPEWKQNEIADPEFSIAAGGVSERHMRDFLKEVVQLAESENFHVN